MISSISKSNSIPFNERERDIRDLFHSHLDSLEKANALATGLIHKRPKLEVGGLTVGPHANPLTNAIVIPKSFLLKLEDIPKELQITDLNDPRLYDDAFLMKIADWVQGPTNSFFCKKTNTKFLRLILAILHNPEMGEKAKEFVIGHELTHLRQFKEPEWKEFHKFLHQVLLITSSIIVAICLAVLSFVLIPFVSLGVALIIFGMSVGLGGFSWASLHMAKKMNEPFQLKAEKDADIRAAELLGDASGGAYFFEVVHKVNMNLLQKKHKDAKNLDAHGNNCKDKNHPSITERFAYLNAWQKNINVKAAG